MGRKLTEINRFDRGMAANADGRDIPPDSAALALNVDPEAPAGMLRGVRGDSFLGSVAAEGFDRMAVLKKSNGDNALVGVSYADSVIAFLDNYYGSFTYSELGAVSHTNQSTIALINNQAYVGLGNSSVTPPKWVGEVKHELLGQAPPSGFQMDDAEVVRPQALEFTSSDNIRPGGTLVSSINVTSGDPTDCPPEGIISIPYDIPEATSDGVTAYVGAVRYSSRDSSGFYGLEWVAPETDTPNYTDGSLATNDGVPTDYVIGSGASGRDTITYSEVSGFINYFEDQGQAFLPGETYVVAASYVYDGYKESPLTVLTHGGKYQGVKHLEGTDPATGEDYAGSTGAMLYMDIQGFVNDSLSPRITHLKVYIAPFSNLFVGEGTQQGSFRLVGAIPLEEASDISFSATSVVAYRFLAESGGYTGDTYEASSGQPESLDRNTLHYAMGAQLNNELFVADIYNPSAPEEDWGNYVAKSEPLQFENFDWINNYVVLPRPVKAIASYAGRVYAFDEFAMYRINPQRMYIEDTYEGVGAINEDCVQATEHGLFIATYQDIYVFDGKSISRASGAVSEVHAVDGYASYGYRQFVQNEVLDYTPRNIRLSYDAQMGCILAYGRSAAINRIWIFNVRTQSWFIADGRDIGSWCMSDRNSVISCDGDSLALRDLFRGSREAWTWITRRLTGGHPSQKKKFRKVEAVGDAVDVSYRKDDPSGAFEDISGLDSYQSSSNGQWIQLKLDGAGSEELSGLLLVYRDKGGFPS